jgi:hypothetical protein
MAGIDLPGQFPNSMMAGAVKRGQSRFITGEVASTPATGASGLSSGVFTLNTAGTKTTANLLAAAGLTTSFNSLSLGVQSSANGVTIAQGSGSAVYLQGSIVNLSGVSAATNPVTITMAAGDVVTCTYSGT